MPVVFKASKAPPTSRPRPVLINEMPFSPSPFIRGPGTVSVGKSNIAGIIGAIFFRGDVIGKIKRIVVVRITFAALQEYHMLRECHFGRCLYPNAVNANSLSEILNAFGYTRHSEGKAGWAIDPILCREMYNGFASCLHIQHQHIAFDQWLCYFAMACRCCESHGSPFRVPEYFGKRKVYVSRHLRW
jgi:hypothetical protein